MSSYKEERLKEFDEKFLIECSAHERTSSSKCICDDLKDINLENDAFRKLLSQTIDQLTLDEGEVNGLWLWEKLYEGTPKHLVINYEFVRPMFEQLAKAIIKLQEREDEGV